MNIRKQLKVLFGTSYLESFNYLLHFKQFNTESQSIETYQQLEMKVEVETVCKNINFDEVSQLLQDFSVKFEAFPAFNAAKIICVLHYYESAKIQLDKELHLSMSEEKHNIFEEAIAFQAEMIKHSRIFLPFEPLSEALEPLVNDQLQILKEQYEYRIQNLEDEQYGELIGYLDFESIAKVCEKLEYLGPENALNEAINEVEHCSLHSFKLKFLQQYIEECYEKQMKEDILEIEQIFYEQIDFDATKNIYVLENSTFGARKYDKFSLFERELFEIALKNSRFKDATTKLHELYWIIKIARIEDSQQLKLCMLEILQAYEEYLNKQEVNIEKLKLKIDNSFGIFSEFSLKNMIEEEEVPIYQQMQEFSHRQRQLQKEYIYESMLDKCRLVQAEVREEEAEEWELEYKRLNGLRLLVDDELQAEIEIGLGYEADKELILDLIDEMRDEFCSELEHNEEEFFRILKRSAPNLEKIWFARQEQLLGSDIQQTAASEESQTHVDELNIDQLEVQSELLPKSDAVWAKKVELYDAQNTSHNSVAEDAEESVLTVEQQPKESFEESIIESTVLKNFDHYLLMQQFTQEDFYFNTDYCIQQYSKSSQIFESLAERAIMTFIRKQSLLRELQEILSFYLCQNSLAVEDYIESSELPRNFFTARPLLQPALSNFERLPIVIEPVKIDEQQFIFAKSEPIVEFLLNPVFYVLNVIFQRIIGLTKLLLTLQREQMQLKYMRSRRARVVMVLLFKTEERVNEYLSNCIFSIREHVSRLEDSANDFYAFLRDFYQSIEDCYMATYRIEQFKEYQEAAQIIEAFLKVEGAGGANEAEEAAIVVQVKDIISKCL